MLEKVATENNLSDTSGNIFNIDESGIKMNNEPNSVTTDNVSKNVHLLILSCPWGMGFVFRQAKPR